jgi:hypothetical protein
LTAGRINLKVRSFKLKVERIKLKVLVIKTGHRGHETKRSLVMGVRG